MIAPARTAALKALEGCRKTGEAVSVRCDRLDDSRLAERITHGVLQNERFLDHCLSRFLSGGTAKLHPKVLDILRMSAFRILFLDRVPASAAVNDAVQLCRKGRLAYASGMVNAVLRRLSEQKAELLQENIDPAVRYSCPDWLTDRLLAEHDAEFVRAFLEAGQTVPDLRLQINTARCTTEEYRRMLKDSGIPCLSFNEAFASVLVPTGPVEELPGYREGLFYVQDDAAKASVRIAGLRSGMKVLDACAAPGGKSISASLEGAEVLSADVSGKRLARCRENYKRLRMDIPVRQMDATVFDPACREMYDAVIADVPCSGTGVMRKHPEIRRRTEAELQQLKEVQKQILYNLSRYVRPGGTLLYSTCSVLPEEDEEQVAAFLRNHREYRLAPVALEGFQCPGGMLRSWPQDHGNDGFFAAKLVKQDSSI